jgi:hypothetical protein
VFEAGIDLKFAKFGEAVRINTAHFAAGVDGPIACENTIVATGASFTAPLRLDILAKHLLLDEARFDSTAILSLRHAQVDLTHTVTSAALPWFLTRHSSSAITTPRRKCQRMRRPH